MLLQVRGESFSLVELVQGLIKSAVTYFHDTAGIEEPKAATDTEPIKKVLASACKLCAEWRGLMADAASATSLKGICQETYDRFADRLNTAGVAWVRELVKCMTPDATEQMAKAVFVDPTQGLADCLTTLAMLKEIGDVEARIDKVGTSFSQLADVMPFYSKVSSVNKSIMDDDKTTTCERFCKVVEENLKDAVAMLDSEVAKLSKLAEKFEWLGRL